MNPADLPTRGLSAAALAESEVWMEGSAFLKCDESTWPAIPLPRGNAKKADDCERRVTTRTHITKSHKSESIDPNHFSSLKRLVRVTGWVQRFLANCRLQIDAFPDGDKDASLTQMNPNRDSDGLL